MHRAISPDGTFFAFPGRSVRQIGIVEKLQGFVTVLFHEVIRLHARVFVLGIIDPAFRTIFTLGLSLSILVGAILAWSADILCIAEIHTTVTGLTRRASILGRCFTRFTWLTPGAVGSIGNRVLGTFCAFHLTLFIGVRAWKAR